MDELYLRYPADELKEWLESVGYIPKTSIDNLMCMIFLHFECELEGYDEYFTNDDVPYMERVIEYVKSSGISEFDYES